MFLSRCCCCIPLRNGLLTWGYTKLMFQTFVIGAILLQDVTQDEITISVEYIISLVGVLLAVIDMVFTTVFIIAGHREDKTLFQVYIIYNIAHLLFTVLILIGWVFTKTKDVPTNRPEFTIDIIIVAGCTVLHILWSIYILLLVKSEMRILQRQKGPNIEALSGTQYYKS